MKQLIKELLVLILIMPLCVGILFVVMQRIEQNRQVELLTGSIERKELTISSPVFGSIEEFSIEEGMLVKKDQTLAVIAIIDGKDFSQNNSETYIYSEDAQTITIKSPTDAVVALKELAEKSTIKPEQNVVTLHPIDNTIVKIHVKSDDDLTSYESLEVTNSHESYSYPVTLSERLPIRDKQGNTYYFATFNDSASAHDLYNNQKVTVRIRRNAKALTGKIEQVVVDISGRITTKVANLL